MNGLFHHKSKLLAISTQLFAQQYNYSRLLSAFVELCSIMLRVLANDARSVLSLKYRIYRNKFIEKNNYGSMGNRDWEKKTCQLYTKEKKYPG